MAPCISFAGVQNIIDGTGRSEEGGSGTAAFQNILSLVHDPISNTLYVGVSMHHLPQGSAGVS